MAYIPSNKIITNLNTSGEEYEFLNGEEYVGFYYKLYTGEAYVGKTPNASPTLIQIYPKTPYPPTDELSKTTITPSFTQHGPPYPIGFDEEQINISQNQRYMFLKTKKLEDIVKYIPTPSYPIPTEDDYSLGSFRRYFTVKQNQSTYLEINKNTFDSLNRQKSDWNWQPYIPFFIPWTLIGEEKVVNQTNEKIVLLQERRLKKLGLKEFLRFNYLKYYRPDSGEDLYTNGGDYLNERTGQEYVGYYHIHPIKGPMVGQFHIDSDHDFLIPITGDTSGSISNTPITPSPPPSSGYSPSSGGGGGGY